MSQITLREFAAKAKVHRSTVTRALRDDPKISKDTRERVRKLAEQLGYRPNPLTSALMEARRRGAKPSFQATIALLDFDRSPGHFSKRSWLYSVYAGANAFAEGQGYEIERFTMDASCNNARQMDRMLATRNIQGLLLPPEHEATLPYQVDWSRYSVVSLHLGVSSKSPRFHQVVSNHFRSILHACEMCHKNGYRRIGLVLRDHPAQHFEYGRMVYGAAKSFTNAIPKAESVPPLIVNELDAARIGRWYQRHRPDVLLFAGGGFSSAYDQSKLAADLVAKEGIPVGAGVGMAVMCQRPDEGYAGMDERLEQIGAIAASLLIDNIRQNRRGIPDIPLIHLVDGRWHDGPSMPAVLDR